MLAIYTVLAIVGTGLAILAALSGHGDHDLSGEHGLGHDLGTDVHTHPGDFDHAGGDAEPSFLHWMPFFSLRFWTFFAAATGLTGLGLTRFTVLKEPATLIASLATGLVLGIAIALLYRAARSAIETSSSSSLQDLLGKEVEVTSAVRPGQTGRVRVMVKGDLIDVLAELEGQVALEAGQSAIVVGFENERVKVLPRNLALEETVELRG